MNELFRNVLEASFHGGIVIAVVLASRLLLKKAPKKYICLLWLLAALRLLVPFEIESSLSLQPDLTPSTPSYVQPEDIPEDTVATYPTSPAIPDTQEYPEDVVIVTTPNAVEVEIHRMVDYNLIFAWVWLSVAAGMLVYSAVSYLRLRRRVRDAVILSEGIWVSGGIESPFVMGFFRPRIYLNPGLQEGDREYVLAHEKCHIRRGDHWWKLLGFVVLAVHWFNPLVWLGYVLLCRDLEMACDEAVVKEMEVTERKAYSAALLACSAKGHAIAACPVAFGEVSVKGRIRNVLNYRKPKFWIVLIALIAIVVVAVCFLTTPPESEVPKDTDVPAPQVESVERWGITAWCKNPSATGVEFVFEQTDPSITGELFYGQAYTLEKWDGVQWVTVSPIIENGAFTMEAIFLQKNTATVVEIDWEWLYGEVADGYYRITKTVWLNSENQDFPVCFGIGEDYGKIPTEGTMEDLEEAAIAAVSGRTFVYEKPGFGGAFTIQIFGDGTFTYYEGMLSCYIGMGTWSMEGNILTLTDTGLESLIRCFRFRVDNSHLYFLAEGSDEFIYADVADGDRFVVSGRAQREEEAIRDQAFYEELFTRQTDGAYATMWVGDLYEAFYAEPEEFARQLSREFSEDPAQVRQVLTCMSYEVEWYESERFVQTLEELRNVADLDQTGVELLYWYYWEGEFRALGGGAGVKVSDSGQDYLAAALEGCEILEGYHLQVSPGSMFRYSYVSCRVEADTYITDLYRGQGTFDENTYAFDLHVTFVPENDEAYAYSMAGNTHEYDGSDPEVPEGALVYYRCGYVTWSEDGWYVFIVGTGW